MKVLLIVNSVAGKKASHTALFDIVDTFCKKGYDVCVKTTQYRNHARELAAKAYENGFDFVVRCGGDGTVNEVLNGLLDNQDITPIPIGYIPCGSTNDFADTLGISSDIGESTLAITHENEVCIDSGRFNNDVCFSYIASFGAFTATSYDTPQDIKNSLGHFAYLLQGIKDLSLVKPIHASVECNGETITDDFIFASVSNTRSVAGIVKLSEDIVDLQDGEFEVILVKNPTDLVQLNEILIGATTSDFSSNMFEFFKTKEINFKFDEEIDWSLDGEKVKSPKEVIIKNLKGAVRLYK